MEQNDTNIPDLWEKGTSLTDVEPRKSAPEGSALAEREPISDKLFIRTIISENDPALKFVEQLFKDAFPEDQLISFPAMVYAACRTGECTMFLVEDPEEGGPVGFSFVLEPDFVDFDYWLFMAVNPDIKGKGYGTYLAERMKERSNGRLALDIETLRDPSVPNYEERKAREKFYVQRIGFHHTGYTIMHGGNMFDVLALCDGIEFEDVQRVNDWFAEWVHKRLGDAE